MPRTMSAKWSCPVPYAEGAVVELAHGGGGLKTAALVDRLFVPAFRNPYLAELADGAVMPVGSERLAFSTDTYVVRPLFFPGGDIGSLAIHGTANDLAMCGARPLFLSAGLVLEEGLPLADLERVVASMAEACRRVGAPLVTGDTKVVDKGKGDGLYVNTSGVGRVRHGVNVSVTELPVENGDVAETLRRQATLSQADMIVMGAYVHHRLRQMVLGGVTQSLLKKCPVPLFLSS